MKPFGNSYRLASTNMPVHAPNNLQSHPPFCLKPPQLNNTSPDIHAHLPHVTTTFLEWGGSGLNAIPNHLRGHRFSPHGVMIFYQQKNLSSAASKLFSSKTFRSCQALGPKFPWKNLCESQWFLVIPVTNRCFSMKHVFTLRDCQPDLNLEIPMVASWCSGSLGAQRHRRIAPIRRGSFRRQRSRRPGSDPKKIALGGFFSYHFTSGWSW